MIKCTFYISLWIIRSLFIGINFLAALGKTVADSGAETMMVIFFDELWGFILDDVWVTTIMAVTIIIEYLMAGMFLVIQRWLKYVFWIQGGILAFFTFPLVYLWSRSQNIDACGCFGAFGIDLGFDFALEIGILKNIVFMGLCVLGLYFLRRLSSRSMR